MEITEIPFARTIGLKKSDSEVLELPFVDSLHNHLQTIAASAQYSLAELAAGDYMQQLFPELVGKVSSLKAPPKAEFLHSRKCPKRPLQSSCNILRKKDELSSSLMSQSRTKRGR
jgi:hypothetical protein